MAASNRRIGDPRLCFEFAIAPGCMDVNAARRRLWARHRVAGARSRRIDLVTGSGRAGYNVDACTGSERGNDRNGPIRKLFLPKRQTTPSRTRMRATTRAVLFAR